MSDKKTVGERTNRVLDKRDKKTAGDVLTKFKMTSLTSRAKSNKA